MAFAPGADQFCPEDALSHVAVVSTQSRLTLYNVTVIALGLLRVSTYNSNDADSSRPPSGTGGAWKLMSEAFTSPERTATRLDVP